MISISQSDFETACQTRPEGYREHVLSLAKQMDGRIWLSPKDYLYLAKYYREGAPPEPRLSDSAENFASAVKRWAKEGFPVASTKVIENRKAACRACPFWDSKARMGLGKCKHVKCGCTKLKWWLETEDCPDGRWPKIQVEDSA